MNELQAFGLLEMLRDRNKISNQISVCMFYKAALCNPARSWCPEAIFPTAVRALQNMELAGDCVTALGNANSCTLQLSSYSEFHQPV